jgi:DNA-binding CsgD family transcriptional regulator
MIADVRRPIDRSRVGQKLVTRTEKKVVRLISLGCTSREAGAILGVSASTIDNHRARAMKHLGVRTAAALTRRALQLGITSLDDRLTENEVERLVRDQPHGKK